MENFLEWLFYQADQFYSNADGGPQPIVSLSVSITLNKITRLIPLGGGEPLWPLVKQLCTTIPAQ